MQIHEQLIILPSERVPVDSAEWEYQTLSRKRLWFKS